MDTADFSYRIGVRRHWAADVIFTPRSFFELMPIFFSAFPRPDRDSSLLIPETKPPIESLVGSLWPTAVSTPFDQGSGRIILVQ